MKETTINNKNITTYIREFGSMKEFFDYITTTPVNHVFIKEKPLRSTSHSYDFTKTHSFDEATDLFINGWDEKAEALAQRLKDKVKDIQHSTKARPAYSVQGFQCSVPRYLQGLPDSMINKKSVPVKQKVITINKEISYNAMTTTSQIEEESAKALALINKIESQGSRCNLNIIFSSEASGTREMVKIRIKSSDERINVSKLAFPLVHPSMLRRLIIRYLEVAPTVSQGFNYGHGKPTDTKIMRGLLAQLKQENEYVIPKFLPANINDITSLQQL